MKKGVCFKLEETPVVLFGKGKRDYVALLDFHNNLGEEFNESFSQRYLVRV